MNEYEQKYFLLCKAVLDALPMFAEQVDAPPEAQRQVELRLMEPITEVYFEPERDLPPQDMAPLPLEMKLVEAEVEEFPVQELLPWESVQTELRALRELFETRLQADDHKERLFDELHREVIAYRNGSVEKSADTMALDIIAILDHLVPFVERMSEQINAAQEDEAKTLCRQAVNELQGLQLDLTSVLSRQGVEPFVCETLDPKRQRILSSVTEAGEEDRQIIQPVKPGYTRDGRLLRKEHIKVIQVDSRKDRCPSESAPPAQ